MSVFIRFERPVDVDAIHALTASAFRDAPHSGQTEPFIVDGLRNDHALTLSMVADDSGELVGHVAVSPVRLGDGNARWYGLGPVSVAPDRQGEGLGSRLVRAALTRLKEDGAAGCVVLGEPAYYARFGFRVGLGPVLPGVPPAYFMALPFGQAVPAGEVSYHPAFAAGAPVT
ncbi:MAG: N-acetyltransferase [Hydrogenophaga sp.]|uniref:GNAT family N-acetyltransferase n=1 Tax=Hydrogenophaga sp. TaxID=1904254 RepID=UPI001D655F6C|nr:N-acetyltransferase [Hydrogenophaga sp.]MBX3609681.1 N-acetyltransferase [Hydrogenophaga sp.]